MVFGEELFLMTQMQRPIWRRNGPLAWRVDKWHVLPRSRSHREPGSKQVNVFFET